MVATKGATVLQDVAFVRDLKGHITSVTTVGGHRSFVAYGGLGRPLRLPPTPAKPASRMACGASVHPGEPAGARRK